MLSLIIRNLIFTVLQPGIVAGLIPYLILQDKISTTFVRPWQFYKYLGAIGFVAGLIIMLWCIASFAIDGLGTLSPADPTKKLVITRLYKFSRNPMYVGVMLMLIGQAIFYQSTFLLVYLIGIFLAFNLFVIFKEEPRLRKDFGEDYNNYCRKVRRWI